GIKSAMLLPPLNLREFLTRCGMGMGALGFAQTLGAGEPVTGANNPLAPHAPHFPARAKRVIHFFLNGGPSHVDTFDPKPTLEKYAGKPMPGGNLPTERKTCGAMPS